MKKIIIKAIIVSFVIVSFNYKVSADDVKQLNS